MPVPDLTNFQLLRVLAMLNRISDAVRLFKELETRAQKAEEESATRPLKSDTMRSIVINRTLFDDASELIKQSHADTAR